MTEMVIGTSGRVVADYAQDATEIFGRVGERLRAMVEHGFSLTYEGPDAETRFNPGLLKVTREATLAVNESMARFARSLAAVTDNIARSLGGQGGFEIQVRPPVLDFPAPPGSTSDDFRIDVGQFDHFLTVVVPDTKTQVAALIQQNRDRFNAIPRASRGSVGWAGASREHAQNVVVPAHSDYMMAALDNAVAQIIEFMETAKRNALGADEAGVVPVG